MLRDLTSFHVYRAPDEPVAGEPVTEPVSTEPEETPFELPEDFADQVKGWGVPLDEIPQAVARHKGLQSEDGVVDEWIALGQNLGFGIKELQRLFEDEVAPPAAPVVPAAPEVDPILGDDPERLLTAAEVKQIMDDQRAQFEGRFTASEQERAEKEQEARTKVVFGAIEGWFEKNEISDPDERRLIAQMGEATIAAGADSYDPAVSLAALERGKAAYDAFVEKQAQAYLAKKAGTAQGQPTGLGGGTAGGEAEPETDYAKLGQGALSAAKAKVRERLRASGELDH